MTQHVEKKSFTIFLNIIKGWERRVTGRQVVLVRGLFSPKFSDVTKIGTAESLLIFKCSWHPLHGYHT